MIRKTKKEVITAFRTREILDAARRVMEHRGLEATMEEIAAAAGVAKGTLYLYFPGKEDLMRALMNQVGEKLLQDLEAIVAGDYSATEKLKSAVAMLLGYLERERVLFPAYAREFLRRDQPARRSPWRPIRELEEESLALLTRLFAEGMAAGQFYPANPRLLAFMLRGLIRAMGFYQMQEPSQDAVKEGLSALLTLLSAGIIRHTDSSTEVAAT
jgi:AcrR family transcriptional regulator